VSELTSRTEIPSIAGEVPYQTATTEDASTMTAKISRALM